MVVGEGVGMITKSTRSLDLSGKADIVDGRIQRDETIIKPPRCGPAILKFTTHKMHQ